MDPIDSELFAEEDMSVLLSPLTHPADKEKGSGSDEQCTLAPDDSHAGRPRLDNASNMLAPENVVSNCPPTLPILAHQLVKPENTEPFSEPDTCIQTVDEKTHETSQQSVERLPLVITIDEETPDNSEQRAESIPCPATNRETQTSNNSQPQRKSSPPLVALDEPTLPPSECDGGLTGVPQPVQGVSGSRHYDKPPVLEPADAILDDDDVVCVYQDPPTLLPEVAVTRRRHGIVRKRVFYGDIVDSDILTETIKVARAEQRSSPSDALKVAVCSGGLLSSAVANSAKRKLFALNKLDAAGAARIPGRTGLRIGQAIGARMPPRVRSGGPHPRMRKPRDKKSTFVPSHLVADNLGTEQTSASSESPRCITQHVRRIDAADKLAYRRRAVHPDISLHRLSNGRFTSAPADQCSGPAAPVRLLTGWTSSQPLVKPDNISARCGYVNIRNLVREAFVSLSPPPGDVLHLPAHRELIQPTWDVGAEGELPSRDGVFSNTALDDFIYERCMLKLSFPVPGPMMPTEPPPDRGSRWRPTPITPATTEPQWRHPTEPKFKTLLEKQVWLGLRSPADLASVPARAAADDGAAMPLHSLLRPPRYLAIARAPRDLLVHRAGKLLPLCKVTHRSLDVRRSWDDAGRSADCVQFAYVGHRQVRIRGSEPLGAGPHTRAWGRLVRPEAVRRRVDAWRSGELAVTTVVIGRADVLAAVTALCGETAPARLDRRTTPSTLGKRRVFIDSFADQLVDLEEERTVTGDGHKVEDGARAPVASVETAGIDSTSPRHDATQVDEERTIIGDGCEAEDGTEVPFASVEAYDADSMNVFRDVTQGTTPQMEAGLNSTMEGDVCTHTGRRASREAEVQACLGPDTVVECHDLTVASESESECSELISDSEEDTAPLASRQDIDTAVGDSEEHALQCDEDRWSISTVSSSWSDKSPSADVYTRARSGQTMLQLGVSEQPGDDATKPDAYNRDNSRDHCGLDSARADIHEEANQPIHDRSGCSEPVPQDVPNFADPVDRANTALCSAASSTGCRANQQRLLPVGSEYDSAANPDSYKMDTEKVIKLSSHEIKSEDIETMGECEHPVSKPEQSLQLKEPMSALSPACRSQMSMTTENTDKKPTVVMSPHNGDETNLSNRAANKLEESGELSDHEVPQPRPVLVSATSLVARPVVKADVETTCEGNESRRSTHGSRCAKSRERLSPLLKEAPHVSTVLPPMSDLSDEGSDIGHAESLQERAPTSLSMLPNSNGAKRYPRVLVPRYALTAVRPYCIFHEVHNCPEYRPGGHCFMQRSRCRLLQLHRDIAVRSGRLPRLPLRQRHTARTFGRVAPKERPQPPPPDSCCVTTLLRDGEPLPARPTPDLHRLALPDHVDIAAVVGVVALVAPGPRRGLPHGHAVCLRNGVVVPLSTWSTIGAGWQLEPADRVVVTASDGRRFQNAPDRGCTAPVDVVGGPGELVRPLLADLNQQIELGLLMLTSDWRGGVTLTPSRGRVRCKQRLRRVDARRRAMFADGAAVVRRATSGELTLLGAVADDEQDGSPKQQRAGHTSPAADTADAGAHAMGAPSSAGDQAAPPAADTAHAGAHAMGAPSSAGDQAAPRCHRLPDPSQVCGATVAQRQGALASLAPHEVTVCDGSRGAPTGSAGSPPRKRRRVVSCDSVDTGHKRRRAADVAGGAAGVAANHEPRRRSGGDPPVVLRLDDDRSAMCGDSTDTQLKPEPVRSSSEPVGEGTQSNPVGVTSCCLAASWTVARPTPKVAKSSWGGPLTFARKKAKVTTLARAVGSSSEIANNGTSAVRDKDDVGKKKVAPIKLKLAFKPYVPTMELFKDSSHTDRPGVVPSVRPVQTTFVACANGVSPRVKTSQKPAMASRVVRRSFLCEPATRSPRRRPVSSASRRPARSVRRAVSTLRRQGHRAAGSVQCPPTGTVDPLTTTCWSAAAGDRQATQQSPAKLCQPLEVTLLGESDLSDDDVEMVETSPVRRSPCAAAARSPGDGSHE